MTDSKPNCQYNWHLLSCRERASAHIIVVTVFCVNVSRLCDAWEEQCAVDKIIPGPCICGRGAVVTSLSAYALCTCASANDVD